MIEQQWGRVLEEYGRVYWEHWLQDDVCTELHQYGDNWARRAPETSCCHWKRIGVHSSWDGVEAAESIKRPCISFTRSMAAGQQRRTRFFCKPSSTASTTPHTQLLMYLLRHFSPPIAFCTVPPIAPSLVNCFPITPSLSSGPPIDCAVPPRAPCSVH